MTIGATDPHEVQYLKTMPYSEASALQNQDCYACTYITFGH